jgi:hypothetical protein
MGSSLEDSDNMYKLRQNWLSAARPVFPVAPATASAIKPARPGSRNFTSFQHGCFDLKAVKKTIIVSSGPIFLAGLSRKYVRGDTRSVARFCEKMGSEYFIGRVRSPTRIALIDALKTYSDPITSTIRNS